jgi:hypothetical protein
MLIFLLTNRGCRSTRNLIISKKLVLFFFSSGKPHMSGAECVNVHHMHVQESQKMSLKIIGV